MLARRAKPRLLFVFSLFLLGFSPRSASTDVFASEREPLPLPDILALEGYQHTACARMAKVVAEAGGHGVNHLPLNHWLGTQAHHSSLASSTHQLLPWKLSSPYCSQCSIVSDNTELSTTDIDALHFGLPAVATAASICVHASHTDISASVFLLPNVPYQTNAALQLLDNMVHFLHLLTDNQQHLPAVVDTHIMLYTYQAARPWALPGKETAIFIFGLHPPALLTHSPDSPILFEDGISPVNLSPTAVAFQPLRTTQMVEDPPLYGMCSFADKPTNLTVELIQHGTEGLPADAVRGKAGGMVNNVQIFRATPQRIRGSPVDNLYGVCPPPFSVWFPELVSEVLEFYKEAGVMARQAIATRCRTASTWLKFIYLVLAPEFEAMWLEACGAATAGLKAATGQYCVLVVGAELVLILLVAVLVWLIRRLLRFEIACSSGQAATAARVDESFKTHDRHIAHNKALKAELESAFQRRRLAQHLTTGHHMRAGRRHKAVRATLRRLSKQQTQAKRQRQALKKMHRRACVHQTALGQQMRHVQEVLETVLQVGRSMRDGNNAQAVDLRHLKDDYLESKNLQVGDITALRQEVDSLTAQLSTELRTQELQQSHSALIVELRSQLSAGQETHEALHAKVSTLEQAQAAVAAAAETSAAATTSLSAMEAPLPTQAARSGSGGGADADVHFGMADLDENGSVIIEPSADSHSCGPELDNPGALRSISPVGAHTIPTTRSHRDHRGDFGTYQVERSGPSYLSTVTTIPPSKPASFSVPVVKPSRFQQHNEVFNRVNSGLELGSPKGRRGPSAVNPFADRLTPTHSQNLTAAVQLSAYSAATGCSTTPLLQQGSVALPEPVRPPPVRRANSVVRLLRKLKPQLSLHR